MGPFQRTVHCWRARRRGDTGSIVFQVCARARTARSPVLRPVNPGLSRGDGRTRGHGLANVDRATGPLAWPQINDR